MTTDEMTPRPTSTTTDGRCPTCGHCPHTRSAVKTATTAGITVTRTSCLDCGITVTHTSCLDCGVALRSESTRR